MERIFSYDWECGSFATLQYAPNAFVACSGGNYLETNYSCTVSCKSGARAKSGTMFVKAYETTCLSSGRWSNEQLQCMPVNCSMPQIPDHGGVVCSGSRYQNVRLLQTFTGFNF